MKKTVVEIQNLCRQIVENFNPQKIILFGSHAYGKPNEDSDVDLLIVLPFNGRHAEQSVRIRRRIKSSIPLDLLVRTPKEISEKLQNSLIILTAHPVEYRYPGVSTSKAEAKEAIKYCRTVRETARQFFGI